MMSPNFARLEKLVYEFHHNVPTDPAQAGRPVLILLHGLGGDRDDWMNPFQDRNWPYDHQHDPSLVDLGVHPTPPIAKLPGLETTYFMSPRLASNSLGRDGSDNRSWWHALVQAGFPVFTYSQLPELLAPESKERGPSFDGGPVAELKRFMATAQQDVLSDPSLRGRQVVILGHSRGGLIGRAYLGDPEVKADHTGRFPRVTGLITLSSPHQGSHMALLDDKIVEYLNKIQNIIPKLPNDVGNQVINSLKAKARAYVGPFGDEIEPGSPMFRAMESREPIRPGVRCISVGGTSPRLMRIYWWTFAADSLVPKRSASGKIEFRWRATPHEAKLASPLLDGLNLKLLGLELDEIMVGRGDGLTADKRCQFPPSFHAEEHLSFALSHAEELWDLRLQNEVLRRLDTFRS